jgi:hypothetical protein
VTGPQGFYTLIQYSAAPERHEFVNIGVALFVPDRRFVAARFSRTQRRVERLFGRQSKGFLDAIKAGFARRLEVEFAERFDVERLNSFAKTRANNIRITRILPIRVNNPRDDLDELFDTLVGDDAQGRRLPKVTFELRRRFERAGVAKFLQKPLPIRLPQGVTIEVPFAYRNGAFNLIDPVRLSGDANEALAQASVRAIESQWLRQHSREQGEPAELVVIGEFAGQKKRFVSAVNQLMQERDVRFYDMKNLEPLINDIRETAVQQELITGN